MGLSEDSLGDSMSNQFVRPQLSCLLLGLIVEFNAIGLSKIFNILGAGLSALANSLRNVVKLLLGVLKFS